MNVGPPNTLPSWLFVFGAGRLLKREVAKCKWPFQTARLAYTANSFAFSENRFEEKLVDCFARPVQCGTMLQEQAMQMAFLEAQVEKVCKQRSAWTDSELDELKLKVRLQVLPSEIFRKERHTRCTHASPRLVSHILQQQHGGQLAEFGLLPCRFRTRQCLTGTCYLSLRCALCLPFAMHITAGLPVQHPASATASNP